VQTDGTEKVAVTLFRGPCNSGDKIPLKADMLHLFFPGTLPASMPPGPPYHLRDIVRVPASVNRTLHNFYYHNSHLSAMSRTAESTKPTAWGQDQSKGAPIRPGVILGLSSDFAIVAMFTTLRGKGISRVKGVLRPLMATVLPVNHKGDFETSSWMPSLAVHPTWRTPPTATHTLCLCLKHVVPIDKLKPWRWKDEPTMGKPKMCQDDFRLLLQLCEKNEGLRGLFASESWLFEDFSLIDFMKRRD
jgi:hypothetical protein